MMKHADNDHDDGVDGENYRGDNYGSSGIAFIERSFFCVVADKQVDPGFVLKEALVLGDVVGDDTTTSKRVRGKSNRKRQHGNMHKWEST